jgi:hypothetical protein
MIKKTNEILYPQMIKIINGILYFPYLKKLDTYLLLNFPRLWVTKLHYVFYYAGLIDISIVLFFAFYKIRQEQMFILQALSFVILPFFEFVSTIYWCWKHESYNLKKQYSLFYYNKKFKQKFIRFSLEMLGYIACIIVIFSPSIALNVSIQYIISPTFSKTQLVTDLLIIDLIDIDTFNYIRRKDINTITDFNVYISKLKVDLEKAEAKDKVDDNNNSYQKSIDRLKLEDPLDKIATDKNIALLENNTIDERTLNLLKDLFKSDKTEFTKIKNTVDEITMSIKNPKSKNPKSEKILKQISQYTDLAKENKLAIHKKLHTGKINIRTAYTLIYENQGLTLPIVFLSLGFIFLLVFLAINTELDDWSKVIGGLIIYLTIVFLIYSFLPYKLFIFPIFIFLPTIIVLCQALLFRRNKFYSSFKTVSLIVFPFAIFISFVSYILILPDNENLNLSDSEIYRILSDKSYLSLVYIPIIWDLKNQLTRQLFLPKQRIKK